MLQHILHNIFTQRNISMVHVLYTRALTTHGQYKMRFNSTQYLQHTFLHRHIVCNTIFLQNILRHALQRTVFTTNSLPNIIPLLFFENPLSSIT